MNDASLMFPDIGYQSFDLGESKTIVNVLKAENHGVIVSLDYSTSRAVGSHRLTSKEIEIVSDFHPSKDAVLLCFNSATEIDKFIDQLESARRALGVKLVGDLQAELEANLAEEDAAEDLLTETGEPIVAEEFESDDGF